MIEEPPLLRINNKRNRPTPAQIAAFEGVPTGVVADALGGHNTMGVGVRPVAGGNKLPSSLVGPALTVECGPGDILALLAALKFIEPGDVMIGDAHGHQGCAVMGDRLMGMIKNNGGAGFVTDSPVRDLDGIIEVGLPVYCSGLNPASPFSSGPGTVGFPVNIGGQPVMTGDIIVADEDGVVVVPFEKIFETAKQVEKIVELEKNLDREVADGLKIPEAIEELLKSDKVSYEK